MRRSTRRKRGPRRPPAPLDEPIVVGVCAMDKKARAAAAPAAAGRARTAQSIEEQKDETTSSKPMQAILSRLAGFAPGEFKIIIFGDDVILNQPIERWPVVECFISFFSDGFPLPKAEAYVDLVKPAFVVNDLHMQHLLLDRRHVYNTLIAHGIPVPRHVVIDRDRGVEAFAPTACRDEDYEETEEYLRVGSTKIVKPFVEKPVNAEDHNICIYYGHTLGGGMKRLFRKVGNQASAYVEPPADEPYTRVRRHGSFLYEDFLHTGGTDVKVYTVGPDYAHAEARKSPVVDGRVMRDENGKEVRYPVVLTPEEKEIARRVVLAFGQSVCGFDLLRCKGRSYVCDVNGWSFVKNSEKYFDDAAVVLRAAILAAVAPHHTSTAPARTAAAAATDEALNPGRYARTDSGRPVTAETGATAGSGGGGAAGGAAAAAEGDATPAPTPAGTSPGAPPSAFADGSASPGERTGAGGDGPFGPGARAHEELRCVLAVIRHGDRTPKQKMKLRVTDPRLLDLIVKHNGGRPRKQAKLKRPAQLQELLDVARAMVDDALRSARGSGRLVGGEGGAPGADGDDAGTSAAAPPPLPPGGADDWEEELDKLRQVVAVLEEGGHFSGINRKAQLKPLAWAPLGGGGGGALSGDATPPGALSASTSAVSVLDGAGSGGGGGLAPADSSAALSSGGGGGAGGGGGGGADGAESVTGSVAEAEERVTAALLVLKFGGVLTPLGRSQAEALGRDFRNTMYPPYYEEDGAGAEPGGTRPGLLRLHSTYRHDLKLYSSDEGRVQMSAAAFAKGLLDLETPKVRDGGAALTPILASLVIQDAKMLDFITAEVEADIACAKQKLYTVMTEGAGVHRGNKMLDSSSGGSEAEDAAAASSAARRRHIIAVPIPARRPGGEGEAEDGGTPRKTDADVAAAAMGTLALEERSPPALQPVEEAEDDAAWGMDSDGEGSASAAALSSSAEPRERGRPGLPPLPPLPPALALTPPDGDPARNEAAVRNRPIGTSVESAVNTRPLGVPAEPLRLLHRMLVLIKGLTKQLGGACRKSMRAPDAGGGGGDADAWAERLGPLAPGALSPTATGAAAHAADGGGLHATARAVWTPAGSESFLLMHARWKKLERDIYNEKKRRFDISKVPDVYDSAKYDAIHNSHLGLEGLAELLPLSKLLADGVVPNEYGTHPHSKLRIGATIAHELLKKLLIDLSNTRDETFACGDAEEGTEDADVDGEGGGGGGGGGGDVEFNISTWQRGVMAEREARAAAEAEAAAAAAAGARAAPPADATAAGAADACGCGDDGGEASGKAAEEEEAEESEDESSATRLHPGVRTVNSPHRHVRTRVYFTSESHVHSLVSVLRYAHLEPPPLAQPLARAAGAAADHAAAAAAASDGAAAACLGDVYAGKWWRLAAAPPASASGSPRAAAAAPNPFAPASSSSPPPRARPPAPLVSREAETELAATPEFDYLTHVVIRMYERFDVPSTEPRRFRLEVAFSRGAAVDWAAAGLAPTASGGGGGGGDADVAPAAALRPRARASGVALPEAAYARSLMSRTLLQNDVAAGGADPGGGDPFLTLERAEAVLWRFMRLPPGAAAASAAAAAEAAAAASAAAATQASARAAAVALLGRFSGADAAEPSPRGRPGASATPTAPVSRRASDARSDVA